MMARKLTLPTSIIVKRNDPKRDRFYSGVSFNGSLPVIVQPETAPKPIDQTSFYGVGRDPQHAWAHQYVYVFTAIQDKLSIRSSESAGDPLLASRVPSAKVVGMPRGAMQPAMERTNIKMPEGTTYGSLAELNPSSSWSPAYGKITP